MKKIGLGQMNIEYGNFDRNIEVANSIITNSIKSGCDLLLLPELWSSGFDLQNHNYYVQKNIELINKIQGICDQSNISICGSYIYEINKELFNCFIGLRPNSSPWYYPKSHLFKLMKEDQFFSPGKEFPIIESNFGKVSASICFDLRFPEYFLYLSTQGVELFLLPAHWPLSRINHWDILLQARAIENQSYMVAVNSVGNSGNDIYGGHSTIVSPTGEILFQASSNDEGLFIVDIDPTIVKIIREQFPFRK